MKTEKEIFLRLEEILLSDPPWLAKEEDVPEENYKLCRKSRIAGYRDFSFSPTTSCRRLVSLIIKTNLGSGSSKISFRLGNGD